MMGNYHVRFGEQFWIFMADSIVNFGWFIRYAHANTASFFFMCIYAHMGRNIYYGSYKTPRVLPWSIGVIIFLLLIMTAFMGYVLVFGQMSLWGKLVALNI